MLVREDLNCCSHGLVKGRGPRILLTREGSSWEAPGAGGMTESWKNRKKTSVAKLEVRQGMGTETLAMGRPHNSSSKPKHL